MAAGINDIIRFALRWFVDGTDEIINVHTFKLVSGALLGDDGDVMDAIMGIMADLLYADIANLMPNNVQGFDAAGFNLTDNTTMPPTANGIDGAETGSEALARQLTALVCLNGVAPRRQGRSYLPIFTESCVNDAGQWTSGPLGAIAAYGGLLLGPMGDSDLTIQRVVCHPDGSLAFVPTATVVPLAPRTQRRRTEGFGA
jgi:hypothetical protein